MKTLFKGKTCLITGPCRGFGHRLANAFWERGANLVLAGRNLSVLRAFAAELVAAEGQSVCALELDLENHASVSSFADRLFDAAIARVDVLVNNAAILGPVGKTWDVPRDEWRKTIEVDLVAPSILCASIIPLMAAGGGGKIINLSGGGAASPRANFSAYAAAKAGLVRFSETLALEVKGRGITVNCLAPGAMGTDMLRDIVQIGSERTGEREREMAQTALGDSEATIERAVKAALFLASEASDGITGKLISAVWDDFDALAKRGKEIDSSDLFTLRRISEGDRDLGAVAARPGAVPKAGSHKAVKVSVQGLWHLGSVTAACLASIGHEVIGIDASQETVEGLNAGKAPLYEPGLDEMLRECLSAGRINFVQERDASLDGIDIHWITYDIPIDENDHVNVSLIMDEIKAMLARLPDGTLVLISSQTPVGTVRSLERYAREAHAGKRLSFACLPENLRLGSALQVFLSPDRIVAGTRTERDREKIETLLAPLKANIEWMSVESAEMTKHAINAFLATSVTFANEIATICETVGADAKEVERGLKTEARIGPKAYLSPGGPFAGGTLARDLDFLEGVGREGKVSTPLICSVRVSNDAHKTWVRRRLAERFGDIRGLKVAVWGLTYKPGTDTLRRSLAVELCDWLIEEGALVRVYDPVVKALPERWSGRVSLESRAIDAARDAKALIVGTEWAQFKRDALELRGECGGGLVVVDANRHLRAEMETLGLEYIAVGTPALLVRHD